jgi:hypothetical protein
MKKQCAWWIVINKEWKILLTKQIDSDLVKAKETLKKLKKKYNNNITKIMELWDCGFTKWKIKKWNKKIDTAIKEIEEEWWRIEWEIKKIWKLWSFQKKKKYGSKQITMFLFRTESNNELKPSDKRHISGRFDIDTALEIVKLKEKNFLLKHITNIENWEKENTNKTQIKNFINRIQLYLKNR